MISALIILLIGSVNHPNLELSKVELAESKLRARLVTIFEMLIIVLSVQLQIRYEYVYFMVMGIAVNAISMIVSKIIGQEVMAE